LTFSQETFKFSSTVLIHNDQALRRKRSAVLFASERAPCVRPAWA